MGLLFTNFKGYNSRVTYLYLWKRGSFITPLAR